MANLDQILFVTSSCRPDPNLLLLDSFLAVAIYQNIQPVLVLTKVDLDAAEQVRRLYTSAGIPVYAVDYRNGETVQAVAALLKDKVSMMTGNSGVGKSTLLNAMEPSLQLPVGEISEKLGRGRHTTRQVQLYPCAGGYLADTPGFSTFEAEQYVQNEKRTDRRLLSGVSAVSGRVPVLRLFPRLRKGLRHSGGYAGWENRQEPSRIVLHPVSDGKAEKGMGVVKRAVIFGGAPVSMADLPAELPLV